LREMKKKLKITQVRSTIARDRRQQKIIKGLGLGRIRKTVIRDNTPAIRGMVKKVIHLLKVEETDG
jgi:large subunit ribosomal protein L30